MTIFTLLVTISLFSAGPSWASQKIESQEVNENSSRSIQFSIIPSVSGDSSILFSNGRELRFTDSTTPGLGIGYFWDGIIKTSLGKIGFSSGGSILGSERGHSSLSAVSARAGMTFIPSMTDFGWFRFQEHIELNPTLSFYLPSSGDSLTYFQTHFSARFGILLGSPEAAFTLSYMKNFLSIGSVTLDHGGIEMGLRARI